VLTQHLERCHQPLQLARLEEMVGVRRATALRLPARVGLVQEDTARLQGATEGREQRPVEVVEDEHELPLLLAEVRRRVLEIHDRGVERQLETTGQRVEPGHLPRVAVHGAHREPGAGQQERVPPAAAGHVQRAGPARCEVHVREQPRRGTADRRGLVLTRPGPARHPSRHVARGDAGLGEYRSGLARPHAVLADDHDRSSVVRQHGGGCGHELHGQEERARNVAELLVLPGRAHVEDDRPQGQQALGLLGRHVLVRAGPAVYSGGKRGHGGPS
jgi:hypothetical protein